MPPFAIKTVRDLIYWQYAKIISDSAGFGKKNYGFVMERFKKLQQGEIFWNEIREYIKEREKNDECIFCGSKDKLTLEHLFPKSLGGPDTEKNLVMVCKKCNSSKGSNRLYECWTKKQGLDGAKYSVPRIAEGKYLKLLYELLKENGKLSYTIEDIRSDVCPRCDIKRLCIKEKAEKKLSPLCLDGIATLCFEDVSNG